MISVRVPNIPITKYTLFVKLKPMIFVQSLNFTIKIVTVQSGYYGYFADGGGGEATINLYKKRISDDNSLKYDGTTQIDLSSMPKIKKLTLTVQ
ncbi:hypothetical protein ACYSNW_07240 [Enterococcus sp. LJL99]